MSSRADRQHADRAAGAVDHIDVGRQQVFDAVAADGVGVAAAEFHDGIAAGGIGLGRDGGGDPGREGAVAVLIDVFHAAAPASRSVEQRQRPFGLGGVQFRQGVADMDDDVVAHGRALDQGQRDLLADSAQRYRGGVVVMDFRDPGGQGEAHGRLPIGSNAGRRPRPDRG